MPMGMAEIAVALWTRHLRHNPANPQWPDRDRFVLSNGHGSMLQYALLHLTGYDLPIDELRNFRQLHSKTPGHPEFGITPGVETTTGPLGQGLANAVGMALAEKLLAAEFNRPGHTIVDHHTYVFVGDGCLMEGISHEACVARRRVALGKLVALYDDNGISIDGEVERWFTDDTPQRFTRLRLERDRPESTATTSTRSTRRCEQARGAVDGADADHRCKTVIGKGAPNARRNGKRRTASALGEAKWLQRARRSAGSIRPFVIPPEVRAAWDARRQGAEREAAWQARFAAYRAALPELAAEFERRNAGELPADVEGHRGDRARRRGRKARNGRHAQGLAARDSRRSARRCPS